jgi:hypothetical protein
MRWLLSIFCLWNVFGMSLECLWNVFWVLQKVVCK